jgi:hypothetical protein
LENNVAGGGCKAWDWFGSVCELARFGLSQGNQYVDYTRPEIDGAFYGELYIPGPPPTGNSFQVLGGYRQQGAAATGASVIVASQSACQDICTNLNWPTGDFHTAPTACGSWTYFMPTKTCTTYVVNAAATQLVVAPGGYVSGRVVPKSNAPTSVTCPTGYKAISGGIVCPFINDSGNTLATYVVQSTCATNSTGDAVGWKGMCTHDSVFFDQNGIPLASQVYYNPSLISATCCK